ncbi:hypothetical protein CC2G_011020 [Coprinopsis cinerea AmutBmut pab1-1]|nr:hypothetical protein CC2G_011020 [Coprinopsis cinerea AmutBmut pab1-1]
MSPASNSKSSKVGEEQQFHILPHPAKSNDPADLQPKQPQLGGRRGDAPEGAIACDAPVNAFHARDPYVPSQEIRDNMPPASSREELQKRQAQLNQMQGGGN